MTEERGLIPVEDRSIAISNLETAFAMAVRQRELLEKYIKDKLKPNKHFYTIDDEPGRKPSLTKEGAELICLPHNLKPHYDWLFGPETPPENDNPYQITIKCILEDNGRFRGEGLGSASSMITKRDGTRVQRQKDPGLRHNATTKMACKSAYIAATLNSTAASEFFTQDLEDDQTGEKEDKSKHWCKEHQTKFFKRGKMTSFAHPVKDSEGNPKLDDNGKPIWCHEHKPDIKKAEKDANNLWPKDGEQTKQSSVESKPEIYESEESSEGQVELSPDMSFNDLITYVKEHQKTEGWLFKNLGMTVDEAKADPYRAAMTIKELGSW